MEERYISASSSKGREYLGRLQRRADFLAARIETRHALKSGHDSAELHALRWAIQLLNEMALTEEAAS